MRCGQYNARSDELNSQIRYRVIACPASSRRWACEVERQVRIQKVLTFWPGFIPGRGET